MTRGRDANHVYVAVDRLDTDCDDLPDPHAALDARDILATILATTGAERSATATIVAKQDEAASLRRLEPIARTLYADAAQQHWTDLFAGLGVPSTTSDAITRSPDAGRVLAALDRVAAAATSQRDAVVGAVWPDLASTTSPRPNSWLARRRGFAAGSPTSTTCRRSVTRPASPRKGGRR